MPRVMQYNLCFPNRVVFGWERRAEIGALGADLGQRAFLVTGSRTLEHNGTIGAMIDSLRQRGVAVEQMAQISREPEVADVDEAVAWLLAREPSSTDFVLAIGGGAAMDLGKAAAALATNRQGESVRDYLEGVGRGLAIERPPLPVLAVPTTAGTGSEATKNAVISSTSPPFKKSLRSERMAPHNVLIDPELTVSAPPHVTAHSGMDAITQLIESYISRRAQPVTRALCVEGLSRALPQIVTAVRQPESRPAREALSHAAFLSGVALANSGLGLAHGVAAALGVQAGVPHGLACAVMLPIALRVNAEVARADLAHLSRTILGRSDSTDEAAAMSLVEHVTSLAEQIGIPRRLSALGVKREQIPDLVRGSHGNSLSGNPRDVSDAELTEILEAAL
jgi:alcohol dehydrogenase class IV